MLTKIPIFYSNTHSSRVNTTWLIVQIIAFLKGPWMSSSRKMEVNRDAKGRGLGVRVREG